MSAVLLNQARSTRPSCTSTLASELGIASVTLPPYLSQAAIAVSWSGQMKVVKTLESETCTCVMAIRP